MPNTFFPGQEDFIARLNELWDLGGGSGGSLAGLSAAAPVVLTGSDLVKEISVNLSTSGTPGLMSAADKVKLDGLPDTLAGTGDVITNAVQTLTNKELTNPEFTTQALVEASAIDWNAASGSWATVTLTANRTFNAPTNLKAGVYCLFITQGGAGGFSITGWNAVFKFSNQATPVLSTTAGVTDSILFLYDGVNMHGQMWVKGAAGGAAPGGSTYSWGANLSGMEWGANIRKLPSTEPNIHITVPRAEDVQHLAANGMTKSRLPILWELLQPIRASSPANATIRSGYGVSANGDFYAVYANYITALLDAHAAAGMTCIIDLHNYCRYVDFVYNGDGSVTGFTNPGDPLIQPYTTDLTKVRTCIMSRHVNTTITIADFTDFWVRAAALWKNHPGFGGYGLMNEPNSMPTATSLTAWNDPFITGNAEDKTIWPMFAQAAVNAIRAVDPTGLIYVNGNGWSSPITWASNNPGFPLSGTNLVYEAHLYLDASSSGAFFSYDDEVAKGFSAGEGSVAINANTGVNRIAGFLSWLASFNLRGALGEFGLPIHKKTNGDTDERWITMYRNTLTSAHAAGIECYTWMGGNHWPIFGNPLTHTPSWHQNKTQEARVQGELKAKKAVNTYAIFDDGPGYGLPADGAKTITVYARGNLPSNVVLTLASDNGGTFSSPTVTLLAGPNPVTTYTYTPASDRVATISYSGASQVPPPRKFYSIIDPVTLAASNLANGANALVAKYNAAKWVMADAYEDYIGTGATSAAGDGDKIKAVSDSGYASRMDNPMEMIYALNESANMGTQIPGVMEIDANSKKYLDLTTALSRGLWCRKIKPSATGDANPLSLPRPTSRVPWDLNTAHFYIACIRIPSTSTTGVIFQASEAESNCKDELVLVAGVPTLRLRDKASPTNQELSVTSSSGTMTINAPRVISCTVKTGTQKLRQESVEVGAGTLSPIDQITAGQINTKPYFSQLLIGGGFEFYYPQESFRGGVYAVIAGPGEPSTAEMNVMEAYLSSLGGGSLAVGAGGGGGDWPIDAFDTHDGFWFEADDITTMMQADLTTPISGYDQVIYQMNDKSGCGNHAWDFFSSTTANYYRNRSGRDAVQSYGGWQVEGANTAGGGTTGFFFCVSLEATGWFYNVRYLFTDIGYEVYLDALNNLAIGALQDSDDIRYYAAVTSQELLTGKYVLTCWHDGTHIHAQVNNGTAVTTACGTVAASSAYATIGAGLDSDETFPFQGDIYAMVMVKNSTLTDIERNAIKNYCASKAGISI